MMTKVMEIIRGKMNKNVLSQRLDEAMEEPEAKEYIEAQGSSNRLESIAAKLSAISAKRPDDDLSLAIQELCTLLDITHAEFMLRYSERYDSLGQSVFTAKNPDIRNLMARQIRSDIDTLKDDRAEELRRGLEEAKEILFEIFKYLTHGLDDPATQDGECRSSLLIALNPISVGPYNLRDELGMPEFSQMSAGEREAVLSQYSPQLLKAHAEIILWTLQALQQEKRYPAAVYNISVVEQYVTTITNTGGNANGISGPEAASSE